MRFRLSIAAVCFAFGLPASPILADEATIAEVRAALETLGKAYSTGDAATIKRMTEPDYVGVAPQFRKPLTLTEQVDTLPAYKREAYDISAAEVKLLGDDAAFVTYQNSYKEGGTYEGTPVPLRVFVSQVWQRQDGAWRQMFYQATAIAPP